jgi:hypothetical protein
MRHKSETTLAWFSLFATTTHFVLETWYHITWGQPLQALLVDYIGNGLMLFGAICSLRMRPRSAAGLLAAAWAYYLGFGWRSVFGRLELLQQGDGLDNGEAAFVPPLISFGLVVVAVTLLWALWLAWLQSRNEAITR